jgi:hypothetical protein
VIQQRFVQYPSLKLTETHISADQQEQVSKEEDIEDGEDFSLTAKMKMVMGVCQTVQNSLDLVASYCERVKKYVVPLSTYSSTPCYIVTGQSRIDRPECFGLMDDWTRNRHENVRFSPWRKRCKW